MVERCGAGRWSAWLGAWLDRTVERWNGGTVERRRNGERFAGADGWSVMQNTRHTMDQLVSAFGAIRWLFVFDAGIAGCKPVVLRLRILESAGASRWTCRLCG